MKFLPAAPLLLFALLGVARATGAPASPGPAIDDAATFAATVREALFSADGFAVRFVARGPGGHRTDGELSLRRPLRIRIDTEASGVPLAWVKNGPRVFLLIDGAGGRLFHLPAEAHETSRFGPLPDTPEGLDRVVAALLHAWNGRVRRDMDGYELSGRAPASGDSFRIEFDRDLRPKSFTASAGDRAVWEIRFTDFRADAPPPERFEPNARQVFDLYR